jgi:hypothetical protein
VGALKPRSPLQRPRQRDDIFPQQAGMFIFLLTSTTPHAAEPSPHKRKPILALAQVGRDVVVQL